MAATLRAGLTPRQARRVGLELGALLLVAAAVLARRGGGVAWTAAAIAGTLLVALALARPATLVPLASRWMRLAALVSRVTSPLLLTVIYLVLVTPMGWLRRTLGRSPIARDPRAATYWRRRDPQTPDGARRAMERPF